MAGLKEKLYTLILKFDLTTHYVAAEDFDAIDLILL